MIRHHLEIFQRALDCLPLGVTITDAEGTILYINHADASMHGYEIDELIGKNVRMFSTSRHWRVLSSQEMKSIKSWRRESVNRKKDKTLFPVLLTSDVVTSPDGMVLGMITYCEDLTPAKAHEEQQKHEGNMLRKLQYDTLHDPLTGLTNRVLFHDRMTVAFNRARRRKAGTIAVLFLDLDDFKQINDAHGHRVGDEVLCSVASRLKACLRPTDSVARFGGDEFAILLDDLNRSEDVEPVVQRLQSEIQRAIMIDGLSIFVTASIGIAFPKRETLAAEDLLHEADLAMYSAKKCGKARSVMAPA